MGGAFGSRIFRTDSSFVGIVTPTETPGAVFRMSLSRVTRGERVRMSNPQPDSRRASMQPRVSPYRASAGW